MAGKFTGWRGSVVVVVVVLADHRKLALSSGLDGKFGAVKKHILVMGSRQGRQAKAESSVPLTS
jgi:hypothetical protein